MKAKSQEEINHAWRKWMTTFMARGRNVPMHAAANTSVGQCTPSTRRERPTKKIHKVARMMAGDWASGLIFSTQSVAAVAKVATASVCPLGKLAPQYQSVSHSDGRSRATAVLMVTINSTALTWETTSSRASRWWRARISSSVMKTVNGKLPTH